MEVTNKNYILVLLISNFENKVRFYYYFYISLFQICINYDLTFEGVGSSFAEQQCIY